MTRQLALLILVSLNFFPGCSVFQKSPEPRVSAREAKAGLTETEAKLRRRQVGAVGYSLYFDLTEPGEEYAGKVEISLELADVSQPLHIDFGQGKVLGLRVQGEDVAIDYNQYFISIPAKALRLGKNKIEIAFSHPYSKSGAGLHRFVDPEDKRVYVYSDFEPYDANLAFPCLDQPDLKAKFRINAEVPRSWKVISLSNGPRITDRGANQLWEFAETPPISTYVISLHAGPYASWYATAGRIPLGLYARRSMAKFVRPAEWFEVTRAGLAFYEEYFARPYPFPKYDQVIVPQFNSGAMENAGAVTFSERFVPRGAMTKTERERRANVILHEMAHMWFGDLVTMRWWNGLWLNESFATYMAALAMSSALENQDSWLSFFRDEKLWGYLEDEWVTTHPIDVPVEDTDLAFTNFDGITYGKGASVLKQLAHYVGEDKFRKGVQRYFQRYAHQNTELSQFLDEVAQAAGMDLKRWSEDWLKTAGTNVFKMEVDCTPDRKLVRADLLQTAAEPWAGRRAHRTTVALYDEKLKPVLQEDVRISGERAVLSNAAGLSCPAFVFPNAGDWAFAKVELDLKSRDFILLGNFGLVRDPMDRMMYWNVLWDMLRDAKLDLGSFVALYASELRRESHEAVLSLLLRWSSRLAGYLPLYGEAGDSKGAKLMAEIEDALWTRFEQAAEGSDLKRMFFDGVMAVAQSPRSLERIEQLLRGPAGAGGLDPDRRWAAIARVASFGRKGSRERAEREAKRDRSDNGVRGAVVAEVVQPELSRKEPWLAELTARPLRKPLSELRAAMRAFPRHQNKERVAFADRYFDALLRTKDLENHFLSAFASSIMPAICEPEQHRRLESFLSAEGARLSAPVLKALRIGIQEDARCIRIRERFLATKER